MYGKDLKNGLKRYYIYLQDACIYPQKVTPDVQDFVSKYSCCFHGENAVSNKDLSRG